MRYTLRELFDNLTITMTELRRRSGISDVTLASIRDGKSARRSTINILLATFSEIYGVKLTLKNVDGIIIQGKLINTPMPIDVQAPAPPKQEDMPSAITTIEVPQIRNVERKSKGKAPIPDDLPRGTIKVADFIDMYGLPKSSFGRWMHDGIKGEKIEVETRNIAAGMGIQNYLTPDLQKKALDFLRRHGKLDQALEE